MMCYHKRLSETETLECQSIKSTHLLIALCKHIDVELVAHDQQGLNCSVLLDCNGEAGRVKGCLHVHKEPSHLHSHIWSAACHACQ